MLPMSSPSHSHQTAQAFLADLDTDWQRLIEHIGPCDFAPTLDQSPYTALIRAIAHQQLHAKAAQAILNRLLMLYAGEFPTPTQLLATDRSALRACGFSATKIESLLGIAQGAQDGLVPDRQTAQTLADEILISQLTSLKGIGRWTVEILMMFNLGRTDVLPVDDFGIREGYKRLKRLDAAPKPKQLATIGQAWQPHRTIASWYLWRVPKD